MPRRFRRRFLFSALTLLAVIVGVIFLVSAAWRGWDDAPRGPGDDHPGQEERRPGGLLFLVGGVVVVGGAATFLAYRRISRPVGDLLEAAQRVAEGDYDIAVVPDGPRELRLLSTTFNDMAARLASTDEERRRFLADVTHELRTPLAVLQTGVEAQLDGIHPRDDEHLGSLLEEIQRLGRLVDDLHTLALAEAGRLELHRELTDPAGLVEDAVAAHAALARQKEVVVRAELAEGLPEIEVDPTRARQVLDNLLFNAVRHTPAGGEVLVRAEPIPEGETPSAARSSGARGESVHVAVRLPAPGVRDGPLSPAPRVRITVTDTGPGFPPDQIGRVFDRFVRAADSGGSGLGLSIARDLVHAHGGTISAGNDPTSGGGVVTFTL